MAKDTNRATEPKLQSEGFSTRGNIKEGMSNHPRGNEFSGIFYAGAKQPEPSSPGRGSSKK
jgi:hypothetical protein